jgi:hypothetical protein
VTWWSGWGYSRGKCAEEEGGSGIGAQLGKRRGGDGAQWEWVWWVAHRHSGIRGAERAHTGGGDVVRRGQGRHSLGPLHLCAGDGTDEGHHPAVVQEEAHQRDGCLLLLSAHFT